MELEPPAAGVRRARGAFVAVSPSRTRVRFENHVEGPNGRIRSCQPACDLRRFDPISGGSPQETIGLLLSESAGAGEDDWHLWVAESEAAEDVRQPGAATRLSVKQIRVVPLHHNRRPGDFGQTLHPESQAAIGERRG